MIGASKIRRNESSIFSFNFQNVHESWRILSNTEGRAIPQTVSRRLPTAVARVQKPESGMWDFVMGKKVALGQVFSENFGFPCQSTFHLLLHNHLHYHSRLAQ
jgi:hypothetical protein